MRLFLVGLWLAFLVVGIGLFLFAPQVFEPILCNSDETIETRSETIDDPRGNVSATDLFCVNEAGQAREVSAQIGVPFLFIGVFAPLLLMFIGAVRKSGNRRAKLMAFRDEHNAQESDM